MNKTKEYFLRSILWELNQDLEDAITQVEQVEVLKAKERVEQALIAYYDDLEQAA